MCNRMICTGKRQSVGVYLTAAVILTCLFVQTIDCYRLKKTERREGRKEADRVKTIEFQEGKIVFGRSFEKGSGLVSQITDETRKSSSNTSAEVEGAYQADSAGFSQTQVASSKDASWRSMSPSLQCGRDQLKFRAVGPGTSHFAVEQGSAPPMPLSHVPSTCGYSMQRNSLALLMLVPYDGCNMVQEGGSYVLPMRWQGIPVSLWCSNPAAPTASPIATPSSTTAAPHSPAPQIPSFPPSWPQVPQWPQLPGANKNPDGSQSNIPQSYYLPPYFYPQYPQVPETTTATTREPTTAKTTRMPQYPQMPQWPQMPGANKNPDGSQSNIPQSYYLPPYFYPQYPQVPETTTATTREPTTAKTTRMPQYPQMPQWPQMPGANKNPDGSQSNIPQSYYLPPYFYPKYPQVPETTMTTTEPTTAKTTLLPQMPKYPQMPQMPQYPFFNPYLPNFPPPLPVTTANILTTQTTAKPQSMQFPQYMPIMRVCVGNALAKDSSKVHLPHVEKFGFYNPEACSSAKETSIPPQALEPESS
ncbi:hypothetical protein PBY51_021461 [Eleginops maclovinus]|uniref:Uncharacterized protein n=1 Tax=Eleginops maclovinus TaxID=56733 RepID=A0AAN8AEP8_ELEMC|nr:hypothetical protein PBY51_021461 [Eleginops maclovinus]